MAEEDKGANPAEQLIELLVYAPVGLLYDYQDVLPKLIKRGKSQVQLARVMGQMAANRGQNDPTGAVGDMANLASGLLAKLLTEIGSQIGLAPPAEAPADEPTARAAAPEFEDQPDQDKPLPIARYDELTAREIIPLLEDLDPGQRARIRAHEATNRNRKTVLAKLDRLDT